MDHTIQIVLLAVALVGVLAVIGCQLYLTFKLMGDVQKFGRLLRKVRRTIKGDTNAAG